MSFLPYCNQGKSRTNSVSQSPRTRSSAGSYLAINRSTQQGFPTISPSSTYTQRWMSIVHCANSGNKRKCRNLSSLHQRTRLRLSVFGPRPHVTIRDASCSIAFRRFEVSARRINRTNYQTVEVHGETLRT